MATDFALPDLGEDIDEADVTKVYVSEGDAVALEQSILEIETEKATLDVPSSVIGTVLSISVSVGDTIKPGQIIISVGDTADASPPTPPAAPTQPTESTQPAVETPAGAPPASEPQTPVLTTTSLDPRGAPLLTDAEPSQPAETPAAPPPEPVTALDDNDSIPVFAAPSARKFAREIGVDVGRVEGTGPGGRISESDIKAFARENKTGDDKAHPTSGARPTPQLPDFSRFGPIERQKLSRFRRTVARNMGTSWDQIPRVSLQHIADVTELEEFRQLQKRRANATGLTTTAILIKITAAALRAHPHVNASLDLENEELILKNYIHIGVAVDTERGLVVPVIRDADQKNIVEIGAELSDLSQRARDNKLTLDEMRGASFTVTNLGGLGTGFFSPVINWPEVAILAVGRAEQVPVFDDDGAVVPRLRMPLTLAFDHRAFDGADGARFMTWMVDAINQPLMLALEG
jgi:pyruvate dehydrogenase E2 component (dihydrolipoamide acetyltransferase)